MGGETDVGRTAAGGQTDAGRGDSREDVAERSRDKSEEREGRIREGNVSADANSATADFEFETIPPMRLSG